MLTRQKYWIIKGLSSVRHYLNQCNACNLQKARPVRQLMADLPASRLAAHNKPFFNTGCDYFGPLPYKEGRSERKAWGLLFTCLSTRAIHVELVTSLDLSNFIMAVVFLNELTAMAQTPTTPSVDSIRISNQHNLRLTSLLKHTHGSQ